MGRDLEAVGQCTADGAKASFVPVRSGRARSGLTIHRVLAGLLPMLLMAWPCLAAETVVTALFGDARAGGKSFAISDHLAGDGALEIVTDGKSGCSLLHGDSLLVELSPRTKLRIHSAGDVGGPVVEVERGKARITTQRKGSASNVEIHTPSARVRPRSSMLHIEVNETTGDTLVTSLQSSALVVSSEPTHKRTALLGTNQWVRVPQGEPPGAIRKLGAGLAESLGGLAALQAFRGSALSRHIGRESQLLLARITDADIPDTAPAAVSSPFPTPKRFAFDPSLVERQRICGPTTCTDLVPLVDAGPAGPGPCGQGLSGEQCQR